MLRVGLTGGLGSGKSTVAAMLAQRGASILSADDLGRELMEPGTKVFEAVVTQFGRDVIREDGSLNRRELARLAFEEGRAEELNAIVHPATIRRQGELAEVIFNNDAEAILVVESALIFETKFGDDWRERFDRMVLVAAPDALKVQRFVERVGCGDAQALEAEARRRLSRMIPDEVKVKACDFVLRNEGSLAELEAQVEALWAELQDEERRRERAAFI